MTRRALRLCILLTLVSCQVPEFEFQSTTYNGPSEPGEPNTMLRCDVASICVNSAEVTLDSNNDGKLNPGESATIEVTVWSDLDHRLEDVSAKLSSVPAGITVTSCMNGAYQACPGLCQCSLNVQNWIDPQTSMRVLTFNAKVAAGVPVGPVELGIALSSADNRSWQDTFTLDVVATGARIGVGSVRITEDDNGDGKLSPGEAVTLEVRPKNFGTVQANDVFAVLTAVPSMTTIRSCNGTSYAPCPGNCQCTANSGITTLESLDEAQSPVLRAVVQLSSNAALTPIEFGIRFQDEAQNTWDDTFQLAVVPTGAQIDVHSASAADENGDGMLSAGETGSVAVFAENTGTSSAKFFAKLTKVPSGVTVTDCYSSSYASCPGQCACTSQTGMIELAPGTMAQQRSLLFDISTADAWPAELEFGVSFEDSSGNKWPTTFRVPTR